MIAFAHMYESRSANITSPCQMSLVVIPNLRDIMIMYTKSFTIRASKTFYALHASNLSSFLTF